MLWTVVSGQLPVELVRQQRFWIFCDTFQNESFSMSFWNTSYIEILCISHNISWILLFYFAKNILLLLFMCHVFLLSFFPPSVRNLWFENTVTRDQAQKGWNSHTKHIMWHNGTIEWLFSPHAALVAQWNIFKWIIKCGYMVCSL